MGHQFINDKLGLLPARLPAWCPVVSASAPDVDKEAGIAPRVSADSHHRVQGLL